MDNDITQKKFSVKEKNNSAAIKVSDQSYVTINDKKGTLVLHDKSDTTEVKVILKPGDYIVETDGNIESITSTYIKIGEHQLE